MGNCLERSRRAPGGGGEHCAKKRAVWAEEKVVAAETKEKVVAAGTEEEVVAAETEGETCKGVSEPPPALATGQVKVRITRKQLEELLRRVDDGEQDGGGVPVRDVVSELLCDASSSGVRRRGAPQGQWRPSLQSIPE